MVTIEQDVDLKDYNTFGLHARASRFCRITTIEEFEELTKSDIYRQSRKLLLGGGSNMLFTRDFDGLIVKIDMKGIDMIAQNDHMVTVRVAAGEVWNDFVMYCVDRNWGGVENLSLIPGTVGAAPIQNIGAYGTEVAEVIESVEGIDTLTGARKSFNKEECGFGYRESTFKGIWKEKIFISSVTLSLTKNNHLFNVTYGAIQDTLKQNDIHTLTVRDISNAVMQIRRSKLPDYSILGNAGSFFKNPTIAINAYEEMKRTHPAIPHYPSDNQYVKIPAGWLIEHAGWKGKRIGNVGVHSQQALVLVNYGGATGEEIVQLSRQVQAAVKDKFNVLLIPEVNII